MIALRGLTKRYGTKVAVDGLTCDIEPGKVTGFLGPNGAGKSTTMRMILGLDRPTSGQALVNGKEYAHLRHPLCEVGAVLDAKASHPGHSARTYLRAMARSNGIPTRRVEEVLELVGLTEVTGKRTKSFSLGMGQRLGIAGALLGDPGVLMFDEPVNGLDPDGVRWVRGLMRSLADEGRTVLVSSHLMSEMQETADQLIVIGKGTLIANAPIEQVIAGSSLTAVKLRSPQADALARDLAARGLGVEGDGGDELIVTGATIERVGELAHAAGAVLHELSMRAASLEQAYMELTATSVEYATPTSPTPDDSPKAQV
ncbi:ATP-binding cassette domain-containing protein [Salinactinospora qingdaonensis]|uniref:ATP-binding cassette domain-containing protein n=1 Tax=Salinactinospora qingdaonensis TaxID=702744 RepID=A0ABP7FE00_9ACTN